MTTLASIVDDFSGTAALTAGQFVPRPSLRIVGRVERRQSDQSLPSSEPAISFGPFRLLPARRLLLEADNPVHVGSRALDILIALVERPGEIVSKAELMARVWPNTFVEDGNLKVHIAALRKLLGDGRPGQRYLVNVHGRGYVFVAPVKRNDSQHSALHAATDSIPATRQSRT